jgi:hypothetical protein
VTRACALVSRRLRPIGGTTLKDPDFG